jgi:Fur family transcriptional regulator, ferric uptake regulator
VSVDAHATLVETLAAHGVRLTRPRRAFLAVLAQASRPMSVAEIHARLPGQRVDLGSVYRTVALLCRLDVMRVTETSRTTQRFELSERFTGHHHHLVCRQCGDIQDVDGCVLREPALARLARRIQRATRFRVTEHDIRLYGICGRCAPA